MCSPMAEPWCPRMCKIEIDRGIRELMVRLVKTSHLELRMRTQSPTCLTSRCTLREKLVDAAGHLATAQHALEYLVHVGLRAGLAQRVFIVEPDIHDQLDWLRSEAEEQTIPIGHTFLHAA